VILPGAILEPLGELHELGVLEGRGNLVYVYCPRFGDRVAVGARLRLLAALVEHHGPLRLQVADPEGDAADLARLALPRDGAAWLLGPGVDLAAVDDVSLHAGAWLIHRSRHDDLLPVLGGRDPFRTDVLDEVVRGGEAALIVASFYDDHEWLIAGLL
jgi:hypothetical protein